MFSLLVKYELEVAVRIWDGSASDEDRFIHEVITEFRSLVNSVNIPNKEGYVCREFFLSKPMKYVDRIPFDVLNIDLLSGGGGRVAYQISSSHNWNLI